MKTFENKVAAVTGAGSGIGRALALALAQRGCHVALSDIDEEAVQRTGNVARDRGVRVTTHRVDVADRAAVYEWADTTAREHERVNLVFNNAGVSVASSLADISYEDFEWLVGINFWGVVYGTKAFLPLLEASGDGHVVNVSSIFGIVSAPGNGGYNATKFAVRGFTEALRQELELGGSRVSATCVHPGGIKTNIVRASRVSPALRERHGEAGVKRAEKMFITTAERAAEVILRGVQKNKRRVLVGPDAVVMEALSRISPRASHELTLTMARRFSRST